MRVAHVITRLVVGGAQENTVSTVLGLRTYPEFDVHLISGPSEGPEGSLAPELRTVPNLLTEVPYLIRPVRPIHDYAALGKLTSLLQKMQVDIVHTHSGKAGILGRLAAKRAGVPWIIHTIHGPSFGSFQGALANQIFRAAERRAGLVTSHFISVADAMTAQYLKAGIGQPSQYTTVRSGFPLTPFLTASNDLNLRHSLGLKESDIVVGKIARLFHLKGHDELLAVAPSIVKACPKIRFLLVGDGPLRGQIEQRIQELKLKPYFVFTGLVPPSEIPRYVGIMDFLVHLSRREGLPRALPQALAAGKPVVAYACDGAPEVCIEGETGYLIQPGDFKSLAEKIALLASDPSLRHRIGLRGQTLVKEQFSVETMVEKTAEVYRDLVRPKSL